MDKSKSGGYVSFLAKLLTADGIPDHGFDGPLHVGYGDVWETSVTDVFTACGEIGMKTNPDINSGNPIGMGMGPSCIYNGTRNSASTAYLSSVPPNLTIELNSPVAKVLLSGDSATGVRTIDGRQFHARKDVILSGGALNTPQLLMLSGIGPADELERHNIPVLHHHPQVGKNLQDHCFSTATLLQKPGPQSRGAFEFSEGPKQVAREQFLKDGTGPFSQIYNPCPMGWFKLDAVFNSSEFNALPSHIQEFHHRPTVPMMEICTVS
jgi:choline dehydrogenase-like flavoprotein